MQPGVPHVSGFLRAVRDDAYTIRKHTLQGKEVQKDLARGHEAHVFEDGLDLQDLEYKVCVRGTYQGKIGTGQRAAFDRFIWRSPVPIGRRIKTGKPDLPLYWVEIKGRMKNGDWVYHLVPRPKPAGP